MEDRLAIIAKLRSSGTTTADMADVLNKLELLDENSTPWTEDSLDLYISNSIDSNLSHAKTSDEDFEKTILLNQEEPSETNATDGGQDPWNQSTTPAINKNLEPSRWYQTGWVWFWLLVFWPAGVYGLIQRAPQRQRPWWITGVIVVFIFVMITDTASTGNFTAAQVCKAGIGAAMGRPPSIIKTDNSSNGIYYLSYVRSDDRTRWRYKCKLSGNKIVWGADDGRWRSGGLDGTLRFRVDGDNITIRETHSDGSVSSRTYHRTQVW